MPLKGRASEGACLWGRASEGVPLRGRASERQASEGGPLRAGLWGRASEEEKGRGRGEASRVGEHQPAGSPGGGLGGSTYGLAAGGRAVRPETDPARPQGLPEARTVRNEAGQCVCHTERNCAPAQSQPLTFKTEFPKSLLRRSFPKPPGRPALGRGQRPGCHASLCPRLQQKPGRRLQDLTLRESMVAGGSLTPFSQLAHFLLHLGLLLQTQYL